MKIYILPFSLTLQNGVVLNNSEKIKIIIVQIVYLKKNDTALFINEFIVVCESNAIGEEIIKHIKCSIDNGKVEYIRVSSD